MVKVKEELTGKKYGRLTVISQGQDHVYPSGKSIATWNVYCECSPNNIFSVMQKDLKSGHTQSCGCLSIEKSKQNLIKANEARKNTPKKLNIYDLTNEYGIGYTSKGEQFIFDLEDYDTIKNYYWMVDKHGYLFANINKHPIRMHRLIMDVNDPNIFIDHIHHNKRDNRKSELRLCTNTENCRNISIQKNNTSGITGVYWDKSRNKWAATIKVNRKSIGLGRYTNKDEAIAKRKEAEKKYFGSFANDNNGVRN